MGSNLRGSCGSNLRGSCVNSRRNRTRTDREGAPERRVRGIAAWPRHQILDLPSEHAEASWKAAPNMCAGSVCEAAYARSQYVSVENSHMTPSDHFEISVRFCREFTHDPVGSLPPMPGSGAAQPPCTPEKLYAASALRPGTTVPRFVTECTETRHEHTERIGWRRLFQSARSVTSAVNSVSVLSVPRSILNADHADFTDANRRIALRCLCCLRQDDWIMVSVRPASSYS